MKRYHQSLWRSQNGATAGEPERARPKQGRRHVLTRSTDDLGTCPASFTPHSDRRLTAEADSTDLAIARSRSRRDLQPQIPRKARLTHLKVHAVRGQDHVHLGRHVGLDRLAPAQLGNMAVARALVQVRIGAHQVEEDAGVSWNRSPSLLSSFSDLPALLPVTPPLFLLSFPLSLVTSV